MSWPERVLRFLDAPVKTLHGEPVKTLQEAPWKILRDRPLLCWGAAWAVTFFVGFVGFWQRDGFSLALPHNASQLLLLHADLHQSGFPLRLAALFVPPLALVTTLVAVALIFRKVLQLFILRNFCRDHVVVCGLGRKGWLFVEEFRERDLVVVIERDEHNDNLARWVSLSGHPVVVVIGNAQDPEVLKKANVARAKQVICVCGEDSSNAEIAIRTKDLVEDLLGEKRSPLRGALSCVVQIYSLELCSLLRKNVIEMSRRDIFRFEPFNIFQNAAWLMLDETDPFGDRRDTPCASPRLVVVGLGWLGESLVVQAAKNWRRRYKQSGNRLNLTLLDRFASQKTGYLMAKYPDLSTWCEVTSLDVEIESREFNEAQFLKSLDNKTSVTAIYVCLDDQSLGLAAALTLQDKTRDDRVPIILRLDQDDAGFAKLLPKSQAHAPVVGALQPFPLFKRTCNTDALRQTLTEKLARAIHEEYVSNLRHSDVTIDRKPLLKEWEKLTDAEKESSRLQADDIRLKLAAVQCGIGMKTLWHGDLFSFEEDQVEKLARMEHERWCEEKLAGGWQYAKVRDDKEKKHNCLLTWEELDEPTKEIDRNFARKIPALLASVDLEIYHLA